MKKVLVAMMAMGLSGFAVADNYLSIERMSLMSTGPALETCEGQVFDLLFGGPGDAFIYNVMANTKGAVKVSSADCCNYGPDIWRVALHPVSNVGKSSPGDGEIGDGDWPYWGDYTGRVSKGVLTGDLLQIVVTPDTIPGGYPASMRICVEGDVIVVPQ